VIQVKRAYEDASAKDGVRFLVDRLWPRGVTKTSLKIEAWLKDASPSNDLRKRFHHDVSNWGEFCRHYHAELEKNPTSWLPIIQAARTRPVTLVYGARDTEHNNAVVLKEFLDHKLGKVPAKKSRPA
jgi:uncharacterized protein YeaO (DUF488 family)